MADVVDLTADDDDDPQLMAVPHAAPVPVPARAQRLPAAPASAPTSNSSASHAGMHNAASTAMGIGTGSSRGMVTGLGTGSGAAHATRSKLDPQDYNAQLTAAGIGSPPVRPPAGASRQELQRYETAKELWDQDTTAAAIQRRTLEETEAERDKKLEVQRLAGTEGSIRDAFKDSAKLTVLFGQLAVCKPLEDFVNYVEAVHNAFEDATEFSVLLQKPAGAAVGWGIRIQSPTRPDAGNNAWGAFVKVDKKQANHVRVIPADGSEFSHLSLHTPLLPPNLPAIGPGAPLPPPAPAVPRPGIKRSSSEGAGSGGIIAGRGGRGGGGGLSAFGFGVHASSSTGALGSGMGHDSGPGGSNANVVPVMIDVEQGDFIIGVDALDLRTVATATAFSDTATNDGSIILCSAAFDETCHAVKAAAVRGSMLLRLRRPTQYGQQWLCAGSMPSRPEWLHGVDDVQLRKALVSLLQAEAKALKAFEEYTVQYMQRLAGRLNRAVENYVQGQVEVVKSVLSTVSDGEGYSYPVPSLPVPDESRTSTGSGSGVGGIAGLSSASVSGGGYEALGFGDVTTSADSSGRSSKRPRLNTGSGAIASAGGSTRRDDGLPPDWDPDDDVFPDEDETAGTGSGTGSASALPPDVSDIVAYIQYEADLLHRGLSDMPEPRGSAGIAVPQLLWRDYIPPAADPDIEWMDDAGAEAGHG